MGIGLRPGAKAPDQPPNPTGYAPPLDSASTRRAARRTARSWAALTLPGRIISGRERPSNTVTTQVVPVDLATRYKSG